MSLKIKTISVILFILLANLFIIHPLLAAESISGGVGEFGEAVYGEKASQHPAQLAAVIIKGLLGFVGVLFFALIIYGGFLYMTSGGNQEKVTKAKNYLIYSAIGLFVILSAYAITTLVVRIIANSQRGFG